MKGLAFTPIELGYLQYDFIRNLKEEFLEVFVAKYPNLQPDRIVLVEVETDEGSKYYIRQLSDEELAGANQLGFEGVTAMTRRFHEMREREQDFLKFYETVYKGLMTTDGNAAREIVLAAYHEMHAKLKDADIS